MVIVKIMLINFLENSGYIKREILYIILIYD
jgi:hypothetical protein